jgi:hypothetical protein
MPERRFPQTLGEELAEFPRLERQHATEHFDSMTQAAKDFWKHDTVLGHAWHALKTVGEGAAYVMSPVESLIEMAAEPFETYGGKAAQAAGLKANPVRGLASSLGSAGSIATQFAMDPLMAVGPLTGLGKAATALREGPVGQFAEKTFSATTRTEKVPRLVTDPATGERIPLRGKVDRFGNVTPGKVDPVTGLPPIITQRVGRAAETGRIISRNLTLRGLEGFRQREALEKFQKVVGGLSHDDRMNFNYHMDADPAAAPLPTGLQPLVKELRRLIDDAEGRLTSIGALRSASGTYWPRMFRDPDAAEKEVNAFQAAQAGATSRRPLQGSKGAAGLLKKTVPTMRESIDKGMELVTDNPIEMALLRMQGMDHYYYGTLIGRELKRLPYLRFARWGGQEAFARKEGLVPLDDKFFEARLPPAEVNKTFTLEARHREGFDAGLRQGVEDVARFLGIKPERLFAHEDWTLNPANPKGGAFGYANRYSKKLVTRYGHGDLVLLHEIGHHMNYNFHISDLMKNQNPKAWDQLKDLGLAREAIPADVLKAKLPGHYAYLINDEERIANFFHAYWHAPHLLRQIAPDAEKFVRDWLNLPTNRGLKGVIDSVKPSVRISETQRLEKLEEQFHKFFPGVRYLGRWYAPEPVARVFNNYVSPGLVPSQLGDLLRHVGNVLNMAQLSLSAFHLSMVSMDSGVSALAQAPRAVARGEFGRAATLLAAAPPVVGPLFSGVRQLVRGKKLEAALLDPSKATPELAAMIRAFEASGSRVTMDMMYRSNGMGGFLRAIKGGYLGSSIRDTLNSTLVKTPVARQIVQGTKLALRTLETSVEPLMVSFVPRVKMGVFQDMASEFIKSHPHATQEEFVAGMQKASDSVDNRLGEMVYDNLFWSKTVKDLSFILVRAVGWNLGTQRELGGGLLDAIKATHNVVTLTAPAEVTERMRYSAALPIYVALQGAVWNYLYTGHGPTELLDYFYPKTGRNTPDGLPERVSLPTYVKDVFAYNYDPAGTVLNKLHPLWSSANELLWKNADYWGRPIRDPLRTTPQPVQLLEYALNQFMPFGFRGIQRQIKEGADPFAIIMNEFGFVPAPTSITNPGKLQRYQTLQDIKAHRRGVRLQDR